MIVYLLVKVNQSRPYMIDEETVELFHGKELLLQRVNRMAVAHNDNGEECEKVKTIYKFNVSTGSSVRMIPALKGFKITLVEDVQEDQRR